MGSETLGRGSRRGLWLEQQESKAEEDDWGPGDRGEDPGTEGEDLGRVPSRSTVGRPARTHHCMTWMVTQHVASVFLKAGHVIHV